MATKGNINLQLNINTQFTNVKSAVDAFQKQLSNIKIDANFSNSKGLADNFSKQADQIKAKLQELNNFDFNSRSSKDYANLLSDIKTQYAQLSAAVNDYKVSLGKEKNEVQDKLKTEQENLQALKEKSKAEKEYIDGFQAYHKALAEAKTQNRELTEDEKQLVATYSSETRTMKQLKEDHKNTNQAKRESQAEIKKLQAADKSYTALLKTEKEVQSQVKTAIKTTTAARQDEYTAAKNQEAANKSNAAQLQKQAEAQNKQAETIRKAAEEEKKAQQIWQQASSTFVDDFQKAASGSDELTTALDRQITKWTSLGFIVATAKRAISDIVQTYQELDDNLSAISAVSGIATDQLWGDMPQMIDNANNLALSIDDLTNGMLLFYQQGLSTEETEIRLNAAGKMAAISQQDLATAVDQLTSTMNAFGMEGDDAANVVDVFANMAGKTATDVEELATAMARTASIAKNAGMSFEQTTAFIATMEETTRLSAETIGNSMKSIIARFQKLKADPDSLLEDGVNANDVEKALKKADVALRDTEGNFRNIGDVIMELSAKWDTLDTNTQKYIATMAAGTQQSSNFIALVGNYQSNVDNLAYAMDSAGAAEEQFAAVSNSISAALTRLDNNWTKLKTSFSDGRNIIIDIINILSSFVGFLADIGPGAVTAGAMVTLLAAKIAVLGVQQGKQLAIAKILKTLNTSGISDDQKSAAAKEIVTAAVKKQNAALLEQELISKGLDPIQAKSITEQYAIATANGVAAFSWEAVATSIKNTTKAALTFITTPVGAAITAIVLAIGAIAGPAYLAARANDKLAQSIQDVIDKSKESAEQHKQNANQYSNEVKSLEDYSNQLKEAKEKGEDLTSIRQQIADSFNEESIGIDALNASYGSLQKSLQATIDKKKELTKIEKAQELKNETTKRNAETKKYQNAKNTGKGLFQNSGYEYKQEIYDDKGNALTDREISKLHGDWNSQVGQKGTFQEYLTNLNYSSKMVYVLYNADENEFWRGTEEEYNQKLKDIASKFYSSNDIEAIASQSGQLNGLSEEQNNRLTKNLSLVSKFSNEDILGENGDIKQDALQQAADLEAIYQQIFDTMGISKQEFYAYLDGDFSDMSAYTKKCLDDYFTLFTQTAYEKGQVLPQALGEVIGNALNSSKDTIQSIINDINKDGIQIVDPKTAEQFSEEALNTILTTLKSQGSEAAQALSDFYTQLFSDGLGNAISDSNVMEQVSDIFSDIDWGNTDSINEAIYALEDLVDQGVLTQEQYEQLSKSFDDASVSLAQLEQIASNTESFSTLISDAAGDGIDLTQLQDLVTLAEQAGIAYEDLGIYIDETTGKYKMSNEAAQELAGSMEGLQGSALNAAMAEQIRNNAAAQSIEMLNAEDVATNGLSLEQIAAAQAAIASKKAELQAQRDKVQGVIDTVQSEIQAKEGEVQTEAGVVKATQTNQEQILNLLSQALKWIESVLPPEVAATLGLGGTSSTSLSATAQEALDSIGASTLEEAQGMLDDLDGQIADLDKLSSSLEAYKSQLVSTTNLMDGLSKASSGGSGRGGGSGGAAEASNELTDALEAQKKALQEQEKALEKSKQALEDQKKALEDQKKALEETNKQLQENYKLYVELIKSRLNDEIDRQTTRIEAFYDAIKDTIQSEIDSFNDQLDALKKQADELKSKADELQDAAEQQEDSLNKLYDAAQAYYDAAQDGLDNQIDSYDKVIDRNKEHIDLLNEQKDAIQDQIDALDTAADSESKLLALEKARDALANARNQKTRMVLTNGGGWRLRTDKSEISNAQSNLASAQRDYQKEILERQQKKIEEQTDEIEKQNDNLENIKSDLEDQKDALDDIKDQWDKAQDALGKTTSELEEQTNLIRQFQYGNDASRQDQLSNFSGQVSNNNQQQQAASDATNRANEASNKYDQQSNEDVQGSIAEAIKKLEEQQNQADEALKQYFENQLSNNAETAQIQQEMKDLINQMVNGQIGQLENFAQFYETINGALEQANSNATQTADYINRMNAALDQYDEWSNRLDMTTDEINQRQEIMNQINNATLDSLLEGGSTFGQLQGQYEQIVRNNDEAEKIQGQIDGLDEQANAIQAQIDALKEQENLLSEQEKEVSNANSNKVATAAKNAGTTASNGAKSAGTSVKSSIDNYGKWIDQRLSQISSYTRDTSYYVQNRGDKITQAVNIAANKIANAVSNIKVTVNSSGGKSVGGLVGFSNGGVDDFTSTVAIHGTKNRPELVLNNSQSAALFKYIDSMTRIPTLSSAGSARNALMSFGTTNNTNNNGTNFTNCEFNVESNADNLDSLVQDLKQSASIRR